MVPGDPRPRHIALIGDIRGSRQRDDRQALQDRFRTALDEATRALEPDAIRSPFTVTTGDEFQAILRDPGSAVAASVRITEAMLPVRMRFGIGRGTLETPLNEEAAIGMDGPCFHRARAGLEAAEREDAWLRVRGFGDAFDGAVDALVDLVAAVREDWTERQREFAMALRELGVQRRVAERFEVSPSTVSESLTAGHVHEVRAAEEALADLLDQRSGSAADSAIAERGDGGRSG